MRAARLQGLSCLVFRDGFTDGRRRRRDTFDPLGRPVGHKIVHGVTSLPDATAQTIAAFVRQHWHIENKIHWARDVVFADDHQNTCLGATAHATALFRDLAIGLIRLAGHTQIKTHPGAHRRRQDKNPSTPESIPTMITPTLPSPWDAIQLADLHRLTRSCGTLTLLYVNA